jgi:hypothetical protein
MSVPKGVFSLLSEEIPSVGFSLGETLFYIVLFLKPVELSGKGFFIGVF